MGRVPGLDLAQGEMQGSGVKSWSPGVSEALQGLPLEGVQKAGFIV